MIERKQWEKQFRYSICLFQIRVPGKNETLNPERCIFLEPVCDRLRIPYQRGAGAAADQTDSSPKIRTDLKPIPFPTVKLAHLFLTFGIESGKSLLRGGNTFV